MQEGGGVLVQDAGSWGVLGTVPVHEGGVPVQEGGGFLCRKGVPRVFLGWFLCRKGGGFLCRMGVHGGFLGQFLCRKGGFLSDMHMPQPTHCA